MTQVKSDIPAAPVVVRVSRGKLLALGLGTALFCALLGWIAVADILRTGEAVFASKLFISFALILAVCAVFVLGIAWRAPVALRMDAQGISGYYAAPATWAQIENIGVFTGHKGHQFLGFTLIGPIAFRTKQNPTRRVGRWASKSTGGYHITVPQSVLRGTNVDQLLTQARDFHAAASRSDGETADPTRM